MKIRVGYQLTYDCPQPTPMLLMLTIHESRMHDVIVPDRMTAPSTVPLTGYRDLFGNWNTRIVVPAGRSEITADGLVYDPGNPDPVVANAPQNPVEYLPPETLLYLMGSRYCETDRLSDIAWKLFGHTPTGWGRVDAICKFVHHHITFGYEFARSTKTAWDAFQEKKGVCRDYAHLAVTLCRCMNIPARYCTGYLGDIGVPVGDTPMDFSGWFEAYLGQHWYTFDARHNNIPRIGRILIGRGRDAADVAIANTFGPATLVGFKVWTDEVTE
jgi:transglutaminase-like putative cysteine protease